MNVATPTVMHQFDHTQSSMVLLYFDSNNLHSNNFSNFKEMLSLNNNQSVHFHSRGKSNCS